MSKTKFPLSGFSSVALHGVNEQFADSSHLVPIYATSTFTFQSVQEGMDRFSGKQPGYVYSRWGNPTFTVAEEAIAALEAFGLMSDDGTTLELKAILHASGQAAMSTLFFSTLKTGDAVLTHYSLYGGIEELLLKVLAQNGIETIIMDLRNPEEVARAFSLHKNIKLVHIETPSNPTNQCVDIEHIVSIATKNQALVSVDNTFATPYLQQPFKYGVDFVFHSTTKFLNGHGTAIGGVLLGRDIEFMTTKATKWHRLLGGNSNPFDAFLLIQGMKTLELRMDRHCENALKVASFLEQHPAIKQVNFAGLPSHPDFSTAKKQMKSAGACLSFELQGGIESGKKFIDKLQMCVKAVSLGTLDTLISHPASMSHFSIPKEEREKYGIADGLIRMSVGIENIDDILRDLEQALA